MCIFALLTSVGGLVIGLLFNKTSEKTKGILLAVSKGAFIYISIVEIVSEEFAFQKGILQRFFAFLIGFAVTLII